MGWVAGGGGGKGMNLELWHRLLPALIWVESRGDPGAVGAAGEVGILQVGPGVVADVNERYGTSLRLEDMRREWVAITTCIRYLMRWEGEGGSAESWARCWNGGPSWRKKRAATDEYWRRVEEAMRAKTRLEWDEGARVMRCVMEDAA